jgi:hypothetical protein
VSSYGELRVFQTLGRGVVVDTVETPAGVDVVAGAPASLDSTRVGGAVPTRTVVTGGSYS